MKIKKEIEIYDHQIENFATKIWHIQHPKARRKHPLKIKEKKKEYMRIAIEVIEYLIDYLFAPAQFPEILRMFYHPHSEPFISSINGSTSPTLLKSHKKIRFKRSK